jgi:anti-sigma regulatory factor (Ser/Thr protein kinase)
MAESQRWSHRTLLSAESISASTARDFVCVLLAHHGLQHLSIDAGLVVSELATNAVVHAQAPFDLTLSFEDGFIHLGVQDWAPGAPVESTPGEMDTHGRGLMLVETLSDDWGTRTNPGGGKTVWASFAS